MFDLSDDSIAVLFANPSRQPQTAASTDTEGQRTAALHATRLMARMFDEIDYGVLLLSPGSTQVLHVNHAARAEFDADHPLQLVGRELQARQVEDQTLLLDALAGARRGLRRLVTLGASAQRVGLSIVPLGEPGDHRANATLLMLGKRHVCERLSVQWFARAHALTPTETRVLEALCDGEDPREVATRHSVGLATVRTQIGCIRAKTGAVSIRELVRRVAVLPPMRSALRAA